jgi:hypothetical protein
MKNNRTTAALEARARRVARRISNGYYTDLNGRRHGTYRAEKSRWRKGSIDNLGGFQIVDVYRNTVVAGDRYNLSAEDVIAYFE